MIEHAGQGLWLCFIFAGYVVARLGCYVGLPQDGTTTADAFDFVDDVSKMFQSGVVLGVSISCAILLCMHGGCGLKSHHLLKCVLAECSLSPSCAGVLEGHGP